MNPWPDITRALLAGLATGLFFFGGLLWTVRRIPGCARPKILVWTSFVVRQTITVATMVFVCRDQWERWAAAMIGFLVIRTLLITRQQAGMKRKRT
ncbi:ATP synthase subunit I [Desulfoplanes formicivorans]|uniref:ATPase F0F1 n=1 Tax=Desulfoplanes formicivorans TaxID=1592317 RepID=A0A194AJG1_9BACT|nr:ATP synthase subunit I [Desulfoplanes formicivorans]GAU09458.1 hypothetical protein DPF_2184 [Desulfoplanes formicivorans]